MIDLDSALAAAEAAADVAAAAIRPFFRASLAVEVKGDASPVTIADRAAEEAMRAVLGARFPAHGVLGEELGAAETSAPLVWVLDPLDGTRAFITGRPTFGTLISLLAEGVPILGVIDQPVTGERWVGVRGRPSRFRGPFGGRIGCRSCPDLAAAELACTSPEMLAPAEKAAFAKLSARCRRVSWGGDCYAYGLLALGFIDVIAEADLKPWDWAALVPVIEGANGAVTDWQGRKLTLASPGQVLAVGDPALTSQAAALLTG